MITIRVNGVVVGVVASWSVSDRPEFDDFTEIAPIEGDCKIGPFEVVRQLPAESEITYTRRCRDED